jgi:hypothetical protein
MLAGPVPVGFPAPAKPLPKETAIARLSGAWELRSDDGRAGCLFLAEDGRLAASSSIGENPLPDYEGRWSLLDESGGRFKLEFGKEKASLDSYQVTLLMTSPDAFTLVETI